MHAIRLSSQDPLDQSVDRGANRFTKISYAKVRSHESGFRVIQLTISKGQRFEPVMDHENIFLVLFFALLNDGDNLLTLAPNRCTALRQ